ncbi:MAG: (2Fe-2S)-binding protein [Longimicrobiales bacterium]
MQSGSIELRVDGRTVQARADATVAVALIQLGIWTFRRSVSGQERGPVCGMGTCYECRVTIDGVRHRRACLQRVAPGMEISTGE